ncbi:hypothetical protein [Ciceribacter selenitireducens]|nr:hypothetical protein [Ciceribacter selenitireducens]
MSDNRAWALIGKARGIAMLAVVAFVSSCSTADQFYGGLPPVLDAADVERAASHRKRILDALVRDAGYGDKTVDWYDVTVAGFNYVDDSCSQYFDRLFKLQRKRDAARSAISVIGQTTNAVLAVTGAAQLSMAVVAQAFGLSSSLTDIAAGTYLYQLPPAPTRQFVAKLAAAYRDGTARQRESIAASPVVAYSHIRGYLDLCLPAGIEAQLIEHIGAATATARANPHSSGVTVAVASIRSPEVARALQEPAGSSAPLPSSPRPKPTSPYVIDGEVVGRIQSTLCLTPDRKLGPETRAAIKEFFRGRGEERPDLDATGLTEKDVRLLDKVAELARGRTCAARGVKTAFEVGNLSRDE